MERYPFPENIAKAIFKKFGIEIEMHITSIDCEGPEVRVFTISKSPEDRYQSLPVDVSAEINRLLVLNLTPGSLGEKLKLALGGQTEKKFPFHIYPVRLTSEEIKRRRPQFI